MAQTRPTLLPRGLFLVVFLTSLLSSHGRVFHSPKKSFLSLKSPLKTSLSPMSSATSTALGLRGGGDVNDLMSVSYDWAINLGAPAALIAGAVIATIYENLNSGDLDLQTKDSKLTLAAKKMTRLLLLSAFALEVVAIFVTTVTGTMLLSQTGDSMVAKKVTDATTPLMFLRDNFEFEYLTARITFLQGLLNWLGAIALKHAIPNEGQSKASRKMDMFIASALLSTILLMVSFYNAHMTFYPNYFSMLSRWGAVSFKRFIWCWPIRPLAVVFIPSLIISLVLGYDALDTKDEEEEQMRIEEAAGLPVV